MVRIAPPASVFPEGVRFDNWLESPFVRWSLHHVDELIPVAPVGRGSAAPRPLEAADPGRDGASSGTAPDRHQPIADFCAATFTDALIVLRGDQVVHEQYFGEMAADTRHIIMSVSKSVCGVLAGVLAENGSLNLQAETAAYVPELAGRPYGTATVRELLDMTAALHFDMTHADSSSEVNAEDRATGWRVRRPGDPPHSRAFLPALGPVDRPHGELFQYCSATTEVLAWVLERAAGVPYSQLASELLWSRLGAEHDAFLTVDAVGTAYACAGFGMTLRDLARFGRLVLDGGWYRGAQVIPTDWIVQTRRGGDRTKVSSHPFGTIHPKGTYRNQWWITGDDHGSFYASGLFGQYLWLDPIEDVVIAKFSSAPIDGELRAQHAAGLRMIAELAPHLPRS